MWVERGGIYGAFTFFSLFAPPHSISQERSRPGIYSAVASIPCTAVGGDHKKLCVHRVCYCSSQKLCNRFCVLKWCLFTFIFLVLLSGCLSAAGMSILSIPPLIIVHLTAHRTNANIDPII